MVILQIQLLCKPVGVRMLVMHRLQHDSIVLVAVHSHILGGTLAHLQEGCRTKSERDALDSRWCH